VWAIATAKRLAGDSKRKGMGSKGNGDNNESGRQQRGQGWPGNGNGNKDGGQADSDGNEEGDGNKNEIRGHRGRWWLTFVRHTTMTHDHNRHGNNDDNGFNNQQPQCHEGHHPESSWQQWGQLTTMQQ
jgi:hypothetical protein